MSFYSRKTKKSEGPDKTPYTVYYPHTIPVNKREWTQPYYQVVSIDPARKNYALRIERRYHNGWITPVVFDKVSIESIEELEGVTIHNTYQMLTTFLDKYQTYYDDCHFIIIERQIPENYKAVRISQHSISYFSLKLHDKPLLPSIVEVDPKLKGRVLGAPKGISKQQLKAWAVEKARNLLMIRLDNFSLDVLNHFRTKQDDLSDTVCQIEALFICWGLSPTAPPPNVGPDNTTTQTIQPITLRLTPQITLSDIVNINLPQITPLINKNTIQTSIPMALPTTDPLSINSEMKITSTPGKMLSLISTAPTRTQSRIQAIPITSTLTENKLGLNPIGKSSMTLAIQRN